MAISLTQRGRTTDCIPEPDGWQGTIRCVPKDFAAPDTTSQRKFNEERCHPELNHKPVMGMRLKQEVLTTGMTPRKALFH